MGTGACGIDCTVCKLHVSGACTTCGSGRSRAGREKLAAQLRLFGQGCPILACAVDKQIDYCLRDCDAFPCDWFKDGPHPFSSSFLDMQARRRTRLAETRQAAWPQGAPVLWQALRDRPLEQIAKASGAQAVDGRLRLSCLHEAWLIDPVAESITKESGQFGGEWDRQLPFLMLVYLVGARNAPISGRFVHPRDLVPGQDPFQGQHAIDATDLARALGREGDAFLTACRALAGAPTGEADASAVLSVLPKLPFQVLLWLADDEFDARASLLVDAGALDHVPPDALAALANLLVQRLLFAARELSR